MSSEQPRRLDVREKTTYMGYWSLGEKNPLLAGMGVELGQNRPYFKVVQSGGERSIQDAVIAKITENGNYRQVFGATESTDGTVFEYMGSAKDADFITHVTHIIEIASSPEIKKFADQLATQRRETEERLSAFRAQQEAGDATALEEARAEAQAAAAEAKK